MKLNSSRQQFLDDRIQPSDPLSVTLTVTPHTQTDEYHVDVETNIEKKKTISSLLHAVAKLMPHLYPRKNTGSAGMRKLMTASVKNETLWNNVPEGEEVEQRITFKRVGDRVLVTTHANVSPDCVQASWNVICPVMTPRMEGNESAREICVVADTK